MQSKRVCPRCSIFLDRQIFRDIEIDCCRRCGGKFLDPGEETELLGVFAAPETWQKSHVSEQCEETGLKCPEEGMPLETYSIHFKTEAVEIDLCPSCHGMWLDRSEGEKLRRIVMTAGQARSSDLSPNAGIGSYLFQLFSGFPREVWNPVSQKPFTTITLIVLFAMVFLFQQGVFFWGGDIAYEAMLNNVGLISADIFQGFGIWTIFSNAFFHIGIVHLLGNIYFLYIFGDNIEAFLGQKQLLFIFFTAVFFGSVFQLFYQAGTDTVCIGASGGVAGLMGAYMILFPKVKIYMVLFFIRFRLNVFVYLILWLAYNILMAFLGVGYVAWMDHVGGFLAGMLIAVYHQRKFAALKF